MVLVFMNQVSFIAETSKSWEF